MKYLSGVIFFIAVSLANFSVAADGVSVAYPEPQRCSEVKLMGLEIPSANKCTIKNRTEKKSDVASPKTIKLIKNKQVPLNPLQLK